MTAYDDAARRRALRRRRLQQRQTVIFGGLVAVLLVSALVAGAMFTGLLPAPFARDFTYPEEGGSTLVQPCPPEGSTAVDLATITTNVYNGTDRSGLAASTGSQLGALGVVVNQEANWPSGAYEGEVQIVTGPLAVEAAYTLARLFPGAVISLDSTRSDETLDVVLGGAFTEMLTPDQVDALNPEEPLVAPEGCTPLREAATTDPADA